MLIWDEVAIFNQRQTSRPIQFHDDGAGVLLSATKVVVFCLERHDDFCINYHLAERTHLIGYE